MTHHTVVAIRPRRVGDAPLNEQRVLFDGKTSITTARRLAEAHVQHNPTHRAYVFRGAGTIGRLVHTVNATVALSDEPGSWR